MLFRHLYEFAASGKAKSDLAPVSVDKLAIQMRAHHSDIGEIHFWKVKMDENVMLGYMTEDFGRDGPREEEYRILDIKYADTLNFCWRRMVCCKELMHAFDARKEKTNSRDRFFQLLNELASPPMHSDFSKMLIAEYRAEWMALIMLCPKPLRDALKSEIENQGMPPLAAATQARVPELMIRAIIHPYYDAALDDLIN